MKDRYRLFSLVLYKDTDSYDFLEVIKNIKGYHYYAYIKHNNDKDDNGILKKEHYHCILKLDNASTISALSKKIGIPENYIQNVRNERSMIRYLIHFDDEDKYQYNIADINCSRNYQRFIYKCFDDKESEEEILNNIIYYITNELKEVPITQSLSKLLIYINNNCYETIYKRYRYELNELLHLYK